MNPYTHEDYEVTPDSNMTQNRVKFAPQGADQRRKRGNKHNKKTNAKLISTYDRGTVQRDTASYDVEDMEEDSYDDDDYNSSDDESSEGGEKPHRLPNGYADQSKLFHNSSYWAGETGRNASEANTLTSGQKRRRAINQRYMLNDPGKALETTNMNMFNQTCISS